MPHARFDNPALLAGDLGQRITEYLGMVKADIGGNGQHRTQHVGRIQPAAEPGFYYGNINLPLREMSKGKSAD